ncbi:ribosomal-protein-alanine N-acetyltransferase [Actinophytocola xinjiangensis]|uniref:[Ribosomal protein bS18]-alanine N-acetyltransferase n=1 Tax=Actinophytocola xinjiangensis TaxID=485602 RepID=A0A7Z1ATZ5_9PSEU|nr:ribosomal protein S18-alanine N-acetyltransferase [Actinophytocola xinjiangensis]OLF04987.1 ribosomal-protein-alanine N-acetyltransferase [Actinophytocola xinjiangensis]
MRLAPLEYEELPRVAELERQLFAGDDPWSESMLRAELDHGNHYVGAHVDDSLVGYAGLAVVGTRRDAEASVHTIGVDPAWQRHGVGRALLGALLAVADEFRAPVYLEVRTDNAAAIGLYRAHGFTTIGLRRGYYQPSGADAFTMARPARVGEEAQ